MKKKGTKRKAHEISSDESSHLSVVSDASYWNSLASDYENEVCSSSGEGVNSNLAEALAEAQNLKVLAIDFGCGPGLYLPLLSPLFREVLGVDLSPQLVKKAKDVSRVLAQQRTRELDFIRKTEKFRKRE